MMTPFYSGIRAWFMTAALVIALIGLGWITFRPREVAAESHRHQWMQCRWKATPPMWSYYPSGWMVVDFFCPDCGEHRPVTYDTTKGRKL